MLQLIDRLLSGVIKRDKPWEWVGLVVVIVMLVAAMIVSGNAMAQIILQ